MARELGVLGVLQAPLLQVPHPLPHVGVTPKKVQNRKGLTLTMSLGHKRPENAHKCLKNASKLAYVAIRHIGEF